MSTDDTTRAPSPSTAARRTATAEKTGSPTVGTDAPADTSGLTPERFGRPGPAQAPQSQPAGGGLGQSGLLPGWVSPVLLVASLAIAAGVLALFGALNVTATAVLGALLYLAGIFALGRAVEGPRRATDRVVTGVVTIAFVLAMAPLVSLVYTVVELGYRRFDVEFFTTTMTGVLGEGGGAAHAIVGTLMITGIATLISVPIGVMCAIYLTEYGGGPLKRTVTFLVDVMTGIPSIVAGLFALALFIAVLGDPGTRSGIAGAIALSVLMTPVVIRTVEEMIKLVPDELREASYAMGVPKWRTITKVVLPTSIGGIVAGVTIAIARVIGETAPLLVTIGFTVGFNFDMLGGRVSALPVFAYYQFTQPGVPPQPAIDRAWAAALTLIVIVMLLNAIGRFIAWKFAPKTNR